MKRHDRKRKYGRGEVSLVDQGTIDYVSTAYFDPKKIKKIEFIKEKLCNFLVQTFNNI